MQLMHIFLFFSTFSTVDQVLEAARHMVAMQIARDPLVRQCVRQTFYERAKLKIKPTKKGKKVMELFHLIKELHDSLCILKNNFSLNFSSSSFAIHVNLLHP